MVGVSASSNSKSIVILGHGLAIKEDFQFAPGIIISTVLPELDLTVTTAGCHSFADYAAAVMGRDIATFAVRIEHCDGGEYLAAKAWNSLWLFHLLSIACRAPCISLYSVSDGDKPLFSATNPSPFVRPFTAIPLASIAQLEWARKHSATFDRMIHVPEFSAAIRSYANSHLLPEHDVSIMLLWAGIEGLLSVEAELSRRLALYAALLLDGTADQKAAYFDEVKKAYAIRSRVVHGGGINKLKVEEGYRTAGRILIGLIARCLELGRVPTPTELDRLAVSPLVT